MSKDEENMIVDETGSTSSQRSGRSLLERIQAQRNREQLAAAAAADTPQQIQVPQYTPVSQNNNYIDGGSSDAQAGSASTFFTNAWSNISDSMEQRMALITGTESDLESRDALLPPTAHHESTDEEYSMKDYLMTFVTDMYGLFQSLPVPARWLVCLILLYIAIKLLEEKHG